MKIPTELLERVLIDWGLQFKLATHRDLAYAESRVKSEGMEFLTISLPSICDALDKGLASGRITPQCFQGFKPFKRGGKLPAFMAGFFMRVFDSDGVVRDRPCIDSIRAIRQVTRLFKKVELPCSDARMDAAYKRYVSNDESISRNGHRGPINHGLWTRVNSCLWSDLEVLSGEFYCFPGKFGSGACAERTTFNRRHDVLRWPERSNSSFPVDFHTTHDYFSGSAGGTERITLLSDEEEEPVRVVSVPKTLKTPRIISVEPSYMMLMQQSIAKPLMAYLESSRFPYSSIRFTDQSVNREMARIGSIDGKLSTIDLKDASDLVHNGLALSIFKSCPTFSNYVQDCRSRTARLPSGYLVTLNKYASMGSALCFPIEAMVFFSIVCYSILRQKDLRPSTKVLRSVSADISVYGDDIIVPTSLAAGVMEDLEAFGLAVNHDKSFTTGLFRESCGGDYYMGEDVTPSYVRRWDFTGKSRDAAVLASHVSLSNTFYMKGNWHAARYIRDHINHTRKGEIPTSVEPIGVLHYTSVLFTGPLYWDKDRCTYRARGLSISSKVQADRAETLEGNMLRCFNNLANARAVSSFHISKGQLPSGGIPQRNGAHRRDDGRTHVRTEEYLRRLLRLDGCECPHGIHEGDALRRAIQSVLMGDNIDILPPLQSDGLTSNVPYATKLKRRWTPVFTGLAF